MSDYDKDLRDRLMSDGEPMRHYDKDLRDSLMMNLV